MSPTNHYDVQAMLNRLANPFWSPLHPRAYALNCEGWYGPGVEFAADPTFRKAWNIFWAMSYKINSPKSLEKMNILQMRKVIVASIAVSRIRIQIEGSEFTLGQLSLLMSHDDFWQIVACEIHQLENERAQAALSGLDSETLVSILGRRLSRPSVCVR